MRINYNDSKTYTAWTQAQRLLGYNVDFKIIKKKFPKPKKEKRILLEIIYDWFVDYPKKKSYPPKYFLEYQIGTTHGMFFTRFTPIGKGCCWSEALEKVNKYLEEKNKKEEIKEEYDLQDVLNNPEKLKNKLVNSILHLKDTAYNKQNYKVSNELGGIYANKTSILAQIERRAKESKIELKVNKVKRQLSTDFCLYIPFEMHSKWPVSTKAQVFYAINKLKNKNVLILSLNKCSTLGKRDFQIFYEPLSEYVVECISLKIKREDFEKISKMGVTFWIRKLDKDNILIESE